MYEKVNPSHPDKIADRIAGSIVDLAYSQDDRPKIAVEVLIGHNNCYIIIETSVFIDSDKIKDNVRRISQIDDIHIDIIQVHQDPFLSENQDITPKCGDNGIFKGVPVSKEQEDLTNIVGKIYNKIPYDGKYIIDSKENTIISCQSNASKESIKNLILSSSFDYYIWKLKINPLGYWTGGINVDSGATNRKLGSDMGDSITGGGLHGKDLSKADITLNIIAFLRAQKEGKPIEMECYIGQEEIEGKTYSEYMEEAREYINKIGGFEKFAEWGLIRPKN